MSFEKIWRALNKTSSSLPFLIACALSALPFLAALWLIYTSSANTPGNDYAELMPRIGRMIEPGYDWSHFARDSSMSSHCLLFPMLFHLFNIHCFHWHIPLELYVGLGLCLARVLLIDKMIAGDGDRKKASQAEKKACRRSPIRAGFFLVLCLLSFGAANVSVYIYNMTAIAYGITFLFLVLGIYSLYSYGCSAKGLLLMALSGLVTSFSNGGSAMFSWLAFGTYIVFAPIKNRLAGLTTCGLCLIVTFGGISWLVHSGGIESATLKPHIPDPRMYLQCFALPFLKDTTAPLAYTATGITIGAGGWIMTLALAALALKRRLFTRPVAVCLALIAFTVLNISAVAAFRTYIAPWYDSFAALFWIGALGLGLSLAANGEGRGGAAPAGQEGEDRQMLETSPGPVLNVVLTAVPMLMMVLLYLASNLSCRDKDSWRDTHAPSSETAVRNFLTVPTYGEASLCNFTIGLYPRVAALGRVLARHQLACYSGAQNILLQGDYLLAGVRANLPGETALVRWISGHSLRGEHDWREPEHLNLALGGGASVSWPLDLPASWGDATFKTKYRLAEIKRKGEKAMASLPGEITVSNKENGKTLLSTPVSAGQFWTVCQIDLKPFKGQAICISLACKGGGEEQKSKSAIVFEAPLVSLGQAPTGAPEKSAAAEADLQPANTDLSREFRPPAPGDFVFDQAPALWQKDGLTAAGPGDGGVSLYKVSKPLASLTYKPALEIERRTVDRFYIQLSVPEKVSPRAVCCQLVVNGSLRQFFIPLLADSKVHSYTYDLKLTNLSAADQIRAFKVLPLFTVDPGPDCVIGIGKIGFLKP